MKIKKLPSIFLENIEVEKRTFQKNKNEADFSSLSQNNLIHFYFLIFGVFLILFAGIFKLQIVEGRYYRERADNNRIREKKINPLRGVLKDRNGEVLAGNEPFFRKKISSSKYLYYSSKNIPENESLEFEVVPGRYYPYKEVLAHVLGYLGEADKEEIENQKNMCLLKKSLRCENYDLGDRVGKMGLEKTYDAVLRGVKGKELIEYDSAGRVKKKLARLSPLNGKDITTTLDANLSAKAYEALSAVLDNPRLQFKERIRGAVIVSIPENGEILALVSLPSFDPNHFEKAFYSKQSQKAVGDFLKDEDRPLFNRAISGVYPPGSTFKIITATAGLETGSITKTTLVEDTGILKIGPYEFPNWAYLKSGAKDGWVDIVGGLRRSNDIFFYKAGEMTGLENLILWAKKFGLGNPLGIDIPGEEGGLVPTDSWKREMIGEKWYLGDTYHLAIGQGYLLVTPLQVNTWTNVVANGGKLCKPHLTKQTTNNKQQTTTYCKDLGISDETIKLIRQGMEEACKTGGTGWPLFGFSVGNPRGKEPKKINIACKTGTAEHGEKTAKGFAKTHAWFTSYAPFEKPEISVTVLVEDGGEGSDVAAPVAKEIFEEWFKR